MLAQHARQLVVERARRERDDDADRLAGIFGGHASAADAQRNREPQCAQPGNRHHDDLLLTPGVFGGQADRVAEKDTPGLLTLRCQWSATREVPRVLLSPCGRGEGSCRRLLLPDLRRPGTERSRKHCRSAFPLRPLRPLRLVRFPLPGPRTIRHCVADLGGTGGLFSSRLAWSMVKRAVTGSTTCSREGSRSRPTLMSCHT